ncbi:MAG: hypothetical protein HDT39_10750 [Lachnospiraceae bacterium]|nr:hypothetical protein [Lachnospiraceae bacterium]
MSLFTLKSQCFTGDTLVSTAEGDRRIDEMEAGDYVWSYDTENDKTALARVTDVSVTETDILVHVFTSNGEDIQTTMFHPFYVKDKDNSVWAAVSNLVKGQELYTEDGKIVYVQEVRVEKLDESIKVYNLEIEGLHTYFVADGVLVHNGCGDELFLPDEYYDKRLPQQVEPGIRYLPKYGEFGNVKQIKMYDDYGREIIRVDYTNHGRPDVHSSPHWHEVIWNALYPKGKNVHHMKDINTPY